MWITLDNERKQLVNTETIGSHLKITTLPSDIEIPRANFTPRILLLLYLIQIKILYEVIRANSSSQSIVVQGTTTY